MSTAGRTGSAFASDSPQARRTVRRSQRRGFSGKAMPCTLADRLARKAHRSAPTRRTQSLRRRFSKAFLTRGVHRSQSHSIENESQVQVPNGLGFRDWRNFTARGQIVSCGLLSHICEQDWSALWLNPLRRPHSAVSAPLRSARNRIYCVLPIFFSRFHGSRRVGSFSSAFSDSRRLSSR